MPCCLQCPLLLGDLVDHSDLPTTVPGSSSLGTLRVASCPKGTLHWETPKHPMPLVQFMCRCGTWGHGLAVDLAVLDLQVDLMILKVCHNLNNSVIL